MTKLSRSAHATLHLLRRDTNKAGMLSYILETVEIGMKQVYVLYYRMR